jgi:hypothetical protein
MGRQSLDSEPDPIPKVVWLRGTGLVTLVGVRKKLDINSNRAKSQAGSAIGPAFLWLT